jgi:hypothetical protein
MCSYLVYQTLNILFSVVTFRCIQRSDIQNTWMCTLHVSCPFYIGLINLGLWKIGGGRGNLENGAIKDMVYYNIRT